MRVEALAAALTLPTRTVTVQQDEEHQAFALAIEDRIAGYPTAASHRPGFRDDRRVPHAGVELSGRQGDSRSDDREDRGVGGVGRGRRGRGRRGAAAADETAIGGAPLDEATRLAAEPKPLRRAHRRSRRRPRHRKAARDADVRVESLDELVEFFTAAGKKGVAINRYKGLGEMNPDTLWETTMDPANAHAARRCAPKITWKRT